MLINPQSFSTAPGVYMMYDAEGIVLYVGKAKNLKNRLKSYFQKNLASKKTAALMSQVVEIKTTLTASENEALLLEANLIKEHQPKYNVLLRDDKSYPYIYLSTQDRFPRLDVYRGPRKKTGEYYGPYATAGAVRETVMFLQKMFQLRQCTDHFFRHRSRPCLQYQIHRCTAPCVKKVSVSNYAEQVRQVRLFLQGKSDEIILSLTEKMEAASDERAYEKAAFFRDQVRQLRQIQSKQTVSMAKGDVDVMALLSEQQLFIVCVLQIRAGQLLSTKIYYPDVPKNTELAEALEQFIPQYYLLQSAVDTLPNNIVINVSIDNKLWLEKALMSVLHQKIKITNILREHQAAWIRLAEKNAQFHLIQKISSEENYNHQFKALEKMLDCEVDLNRMECFDVSHTQGEATVASCVVCTPEGLLKKDYRRFNIKNITAGDDYAALQQVLMRRYKQVKENQAIIPDVIIIDGGKGQIRVAAEVLKTLQLEQVILLSVFKGDRRKAENDQLLIWENNQARLLDFTVEGMRILQLLRDEAHRFAITLHRSQLSKARTGSVLDNIAGIGPKRRRALLQHFGGLQQLQAASVEDIVAVPGLNQQLARLVYAYFHD